MEEDEKRYRQKSILITLGVQVIVVAILYFMVAWREIIPPLPEYGIELSFGTEQANRDLDTPAEAPVEVLEEAEEPVPADNREEIDATQETEPVTEADVAEETQTETETTEQAEEPVTEDVNSPDIIEAEEQRQEEIIPAEEVSTSPEEEKPDISADDPEKQKEETGEEEEAEPVIDERALYNSATGTGENRGATLQLTGWRLEEVPDPNDKSQESGKIVFEIKVDEEGYIVSIKTLTSTVTPSVELLYRRAVEQLVLEKTGEYEPAPFSTGTITFILRSR